MGGKLPIHYAAESNAKEIFDKCVDVFPDGLQQKDQVSAMPGRVALAPPCHRAARAACVRGPARVSDGLRRGEGRGGAVEASAHTCEAGWGVTLSLTLALTITLTLILTLTLTLTLILTQTLTLARILTLI